MGGGRARLGDRGTEGRARQGRGEGARPRRHGRRYRPRRRRRRTILAACAARARIQKLEGEGSKFKTDNASLTAVVEQLKKENQNLAQAAETSTQARARVDQEIEQLRQQVKDNEARARLLADEVLQERILRVRVERELILAKVQEAENAEGG